MIIDWTSETMLGISFRIRVQIGVKQFAEIHKERPSDALPRHPPDYHQRRLETTNKYFFERLPEDAIKVCHTYLPVS